MPGYFGNTNFINANTSNIAEVKWTTMNPYSRANPSADYSALMSMYGQMHRDGFVRDTGAANDHTDPDHAFPGQSLHRWLQHIRSLIELTGTKAVLDYGSGKGLQYQADVRVGHQTIAPSIQSLWQVDDIVCFDPGVPELSVLPDRTFDGIIATDVLEHVPEDDVFWVVDEIFSFAEKFVFASIPCYRAAATLPDGRNAHITLRHPRWWLGVFQSARARRPQLNFSIVFLVPVQGQDDKKKVDYLHSFGKVPLDFTMLEDAAPV